MNRLKGQNRAVVAAMAGITAHAIQSRLVKFKHGPQCSMDIVTRKSSSAYAFLMGHALPRRFQGNKFTCHISNRLIKSFASSFITMQVQFRKSHTQGPCQGYKLMQQEMQGFNSLRSRPSVSYFNSTCDSSGTLIHTVGRCVGDIKLLYTYTYECFIAIFRL